MLFEILQVEPEVINNEIILGFPNECIQQTQQPFPTVISKTNSSKHKNITQQHIKLSSNQAQGNIYKQMAYTSFPMNDMIKPATVVNPEAQNVAIIQPTVQQIQPQPVSRGKKYKFTAPLQPNFKFSGQPTNNDYILPHGTQQMISGNRNETITIQVRYHSCIPKKLLSFLTSLFSLENGKTNTFSLFFL